MPSDSQINPLKSKETAPDEFVQKLRAALQRDGDFPASAKVVGELRMLVQDPKTTANQVTEVILREPSLGTRVLHLVNSSYYRRAKPIMTVSQAVVQIGMRPLAELCAGLVLLQKFVPQARRGGPFANCLEKTILTSLLTSTIANETTKTRASKADETGYLAGSFAELGTLLLAYYFPQVYEAAIKRSAVKRQDVGSSIHDITGLSPLRLSIEVLSALDLPPFYRETLIEVEGIGQRQGLPAKGTSSPLARTVASAQAISAAVVESKSPDQLEKALTKANQLLGVDSKSLHKVMGALPQVFKEHCSSLELSLPQLPEFVMSYVEQTGPPSQATDTNKDGQEQKFLQFVEEIRQAVDAQEPTVSVITTVMETFAWSLNFDRVLLMLMGPGRKSLVGRMLLGTLQDFDPKTLERPLGAAAGPRAPDALAVKESRPVFSGQPLFEGGWPIAVIPVGFGARSIGIIYADRAASDGSELSAREQAAIGVLAELLDRSVSTSAM